MLVWLGMTLPQHLAPPWELLVSLAGQVTPSSLGPCSCPVSDPSAEQAASPFGSVRPSPRFPKCPGPQPTEHTLPEGSRSWAGLGPACSPCLSL